MEHPFLREEMILGADALERLRRSHVIVFGIGGVGSYAVEGLARAGVGATMKACGVKVYNAQGEVIS